MIKAARSRCRELIALTCVGVFICGFNGVAKCDNREAEEERTLRVIMEGSMANRRSFHYLTCEFAITRGFAESEAEAKKEGVSTIVEDGKGLWYVSSQKCRFEIHSDQSKMVAAVREWLKNHKPDPADGPFSVPLGTKLGPRKLLWDGDQGVAISGLLRGGALIPKDQSGPGVRISPFDMAGWMARDEDQHPALLIERSFVNADIECRFGGRESSDGEAMLSVAFTYPSSPESGRVTYLFDPKRGFLPIQMRRTKPPVTVYVTDAKECSGSRWFPMRTVAVQSSEQGDIEVLEVLVTRLDVDTPPEDSVFAIDVAEGTRIHDGVNPLSLVSFPDGDQISVEDLTKLAGKMSTAAEKRENERRAEMSVITEVDADTKRGAYRWMLIGGIGVALLLVACLLVRRSRVQADKTR